MKSISLTLFAVLFFISHINLAQKSNTAYLNFNLGKSPVSPSAPQELSLYGCNTRVQITTGDSVLVEVGPDSIWYKKKSLKWNSDNQVFSMIPYGKQGTGKDSYYVSRYYMASPPVMETVVSQKNKKDTTTFANIGLVIPDRFNLFGEKPVQIVHLDYTILEPVYLNYVGINYDFVHKDSSTCNELGVDMVPLNIQCDDFKWKDKNGINGAKGASGIARVRNEKNQRQVFLPSYVSDSTDCLDCMLSIQDDIVKDYEVFFATPDSLFKHMSLTQFHANAQKGGQQKINLFCRVRNGGLPSGCKEKRTYIFEE